MQQFSSHPGRVPKQRRSPPVSRPQLRDRRVRLRGARGQYQLFGVNFSCLESAHSRGPGSLQAKSVVQSLLAGYPSISSWLRLVESRGRAQLLRGSDPSPWQLRAQLHSLSLISFGRSSQHPAVSSCFQVLTCLRRGSCGYSCGHRSALALSFSLKQLQAAE